MFCIKWTRIDELENDKSTLHTKTTMFWISSECRTYDVVTMSDMISGLIFQSRTTKERLLPFCKCSIVIHKVAKFTDSGRGLWCTPVQWEVVLSDEGGACGHILFFFLQNWEHKDLQRWLTPKQSIGMFLFVHERERRRLSDISAQGHTHDSKGHVSILACVCAWVGFTYSTTRIRRLSYAR